MASNRSAVDDVDSLQATYCERVRRHAEKGLRSLIHKEYRRRLSLALRSTKGTPFHTPSARMREARRRIGIAPDEVYGGELSAEAVFAINTSADVVRYLSAIYPYLCMLPRSARIDPDIRIGDATDVAKLFPDYVGCVDLLVTSPPYATALPYLDTDRLSLIAMGLLPRQAHKDTEWRMVGTREISERQRRETWTYFRSRKQELPGTVVRLIEAIGEANHATGVGFRRRNLPALLGKYFLNMMDAMRSAHSLMKPGAIGYYVVGNNSTVVSGQKMEIPTDQLLVELGAAAGWQPSEVTPMELLVSRDIFKENRGSSEAILSFTA